MSNCCLVSVVMPCQERLELRQFAKSYYKRAIKHSLQRESRDILKAIGRIRSYNVGVKGWVFSWGIVSNHTSPNAVIGDLKPFFRSPDFWKYGPNVFESALVFFEEEDSQPVAYEITTNDRVSQIWVESHVLPFGWGQA